MHMKKIMNYFASIPNTLYINIKCFGFRYGIKLPIFCSWKVRIKSISRGSIVIDGPIKTGMISLGMGNGSFDNGIGRRSMLKLSPNSVLVFSGGGDYKQ